MVGVSEDDSSSHPETMLQRRLEKLEEQIKREEQILVGSKAIREHHELQASKNLVSHSIGETENRLTFLREQRQLLLLQGPHGVDPVPLPPNKQDEMAFWRVGAHHTWERINYKIGELTYRLHLEQQAVRGMERLEALGYAKAKERAAEAAEKIPLLTRALERYTSLCLTNDQSQLQVPLGEDPQASPRLLPLEGGYLRLKVYSVNLPHHSDPSMAFRLGMSVDQRNEPVWLKLKPSRSATDEWRLEVRSARTLEILVREAGNGDGERGVLWALAYLPLLSIFSPSKVQESPVYQVALEPEGELMLHLEWIRGGQETLAQLDPVGVHRQPRAEKTKIHLCMGHRFKHTRFFQLARCALCHELLFRGAGYRCTGKRASL